MPTHVTLSAAARRAATLIGTLLAGGAALLAFVLLSHAVINTSAVLTFDDRWATRFHDAATPALTDIFTLVTAFGSSVPYVLGFGLGALFLIRRQWAVLAGWVLAMQGARLLNAALKDEFARPRPTFPDVVSTLHDYGYPSGHTMQAIVTYGMLAYLAWVWPRTYPLRWPITVGAAVLIAAVGVSRWVLGVHFVSDVIGGLIAGGLWLATAIRFTQVLRAQRRYT